MRTLVEVVAEAGPGGTTRLRTVRSDGQALAVRRTGGRSAHAQVHLVGTAAGPMGGDEVEVRVRVGPGAELHVQGVAASLVLPSLGQARSRLLLDVEVGAGGRLRCVLPPVVVTGRAEHEATSHVRLLGDAQVVLAEHVRLGRHGEAGGWWQGTTLLTRDGRPLLHQRTTLGEPDGGVGAVRELVSTLDSAADGEAWADDDTVLMPLSGGGTLRVRTA